MGYLPFNLLKLLTIKIRGDKMEMQKTKISKSAFKLALLCALVYFVAYLGRLSYSANIVMIREEFQIDKATAGVVGTCLFIS